MVYVFKYVLIHIHKLGEVVYVNNKTVFFKTPLYRKYCEYWVISHIVSAT